MKRGYCRCLQTFKEDICYYQENELYEYIDNNWTFIVYVESSLNSSITLGYHFGEDRFSKLFKVMTVQEFRQYKLEQII